jgi:hypothetical protein
MIVSDDLHMVVQAVLQGDGVSFLSRDIVADHLEAGRVRGHHVAGFQHARSRAVVLARPDGTEGPLGRFVATLFARFSLPMPDELQREPRTASAVVPAASCRFGCDPGASSLEPSARAPRVPRRSARR